MITNFSEYYNNFICPKIKQIDIAIKSHISNFDISYISSLLDLSEKEIKYIIKSKKLNSISSDNILTIMLNGSSYICKIFRKTLNIGCPKYYTAKDLSYIYYISYDKVKKAYEILNIDKIDSNNVDIIFKKIT
ncbi:MAG: hypothetical protein ACI4VF_07260 [Lachnospirales bacterium]